MAKKFAQVERVTMNPPHLATSIGSSPNSRPKNKHKRRNYKKYRGQGK